MAYSEVVDVNVEDFFEYPYREKNRNRRAKRAKGQQKGQTKTHNKEVTTNLNLSLKNISPMTETQENIFDSFQSTNQNVFLHGFAGTGKSFISLYLMLKEFLAPGSTYKKILIVRSTVPSRDQGFLPGNAAEKAKIYEMPYQQIFSEIFGRSDTYEYMKKRKEVEFESTSYLRGTTFNDTLIFFDEIQNATKQEIMTVLTRVGKNCRIVMAGDFFQSDLFRDHEKRGVLEIMAILKTMKSVDFFEFKKEDIVRSGFVRELIIAESEYKRLNY